MTADITTTDITTTDLAPVPTRDELATLNQIVAVAVQSGMLPRALNNAPKALTVALKGRELGIPPMQAFSHIHIIEGKPTISAELMRALVLARGHDLWVETDTDDKVTIAGRRAGSEHTTRVTWTLDDARQAGLLGKDNWKRYPRAMLLSRATAHLCRAVFPDALMGASYAPEELTDVVVSEDGTVEVVDVEADRPPRPRSTERGPALGLTGAANRKWHARLREIDCDEPTYRAALAATLEAMADNGVYDGPLTDTISEVPRPVASKLLDRLCTDEGADRFLQLGLQRRAEMHASETSRGNIPDDPDPPAEMVGGAVGSLLGDCDPHEDEPEPPVEHRPQSGRERAKAQAEAIKAQPEETS